MFYREFYGEFPKEWFAAYFYKCSEVCVGECLIERGVDSLTSDDDCVFDFEQHVSQ